MSEDVFRFKRFSVFNSLPAQKVGTDGVLLGAAVSLDCLGNGPSGGISSDHCIKVLDIGTGTGVVALILAQRLSDAGFSRCWSGGSASSDSIPGVEISAIDIDADAVRSASASFGASPWPDMLMALHFSLQDYSDELYVCGEDRSAEFDLIVSNPPYYDNSLGCPDERRNLARHTDSLSWREVISFSGDFLSPCGRLALILPKQEEKQLLRFAASFGLCPSRLMSISTSHAKPPRRLIAEFVRAGNGKTACRKETMTIGDELYRTLTEGFYL